METGIKDHANASKVFLARKDCALSKEISKANQSEFMSSFFVNGEKILDYIIYIDNSPLETSHIHDGSILPEKSSVLFHINDAKVKESCSLKDAGFMSLIGLENSKNNSSDITISIRPGESAKKIYLSSVRKSITLEFGTGAATLGMPLNYSSVNIEKKDSGAVSISIRGIKDKCEIPVIAAFSENGSSHSVDVYDAEAKKIAKDYKTGFPDTIEKEIEKELSTSSPGIDLAFAWSMHWLRALNPYKFHLIEKMDPESKLLYTLGASLAGELKKAEDILYEISETVESQKCTEEIYPLFIFAFNSCINCAGDKKAKSYMEKNMQSALAVCKKEYKKYASSQSENIKLHSLWLLAVESTNPKDSRGINAIAKKIESLCRPEDIVFDHIFALLSGRITRKSADTIITILKQEFLTSHGLRTRSCLNPDYKSSEKYGGAVSVPSTIIFAIGVLNYNPYLGAKILRDISSKLGTDSIGHFPSLIDPSDGGAASETISLEAESLFIYAVDCALAGIKYSHSQNTLNISPKMGSIDFIHRTGKHIASGKIDFSAENKIALGSEIICISIAYEKKPNMKCLLELPKDVKSIITNQKDYGGNRIKFRMKKTNRIIGVCKNKES